MQGGDKMSEKEYFIYLLSCHLNGIKPDGVSDIDWGQIYALAKKHNVIGMVMSVIKQLDKEFLPQKEIYSAFNQSLGYTVQEYELKINSIAALVSALTQARIPHLLVKGAVIRNMYPVPALRTSGDTDVVVKESDYLRVNEILNKNGFETEGVGGNVATLIFGSERFEIHTELESINVQSKIYFSTPFDDISECSGYTYKLMPVYHLIYVITHIAHHMKIGGAGIRMLMDIDVLVRNYPKLDYNKFWQICSNIGIEKTAKTLFALCRKWFNTPVYTDFSFDDEENERFYNDLSSVILDGGIFGFGNGGVGKNNLEKSIGKSGKASFFISLKALFLWIFPPKEYFAECFLYYRKHPVLLPVAWFHRLFKALFVHRKKSKHYLKEMFTEKEISERQHQLLTELEIKD